MSEHLSSLQSSAFTAELRRRFPRDRGEVGIVPGANGVFQTPTLMEDFCFPLKWDLQTIICSFPVELQDLCQELLLIDAELSRGAATVIVLTAPKHTEALKG